MKESIRRILLVEDNPDDQELMRLALAECSVAAEVVIAADGAEALALLDAVEADHPPVPPALALIDINLPKLSGIEVLRRLRATRRCRHVPAVMLTTSREGADLREAYAAGANSYIVKPVDFIEFQRTIRLLSAYWLSVNHTPPGEA